MKEITVYIFFILILLSFHSYLFYPVIIHFIARLKKVDENRDDNFIFPKISILISAFNEEKSIEKRILNIAEQEYDFSKIEVLVGSDCSDDDTVKILKTLEGKFYWLRVFDFENRSGKAGVLNKLVPETKNDILVFTDANTEFASDALNNLLKNFNNSQIGGVCGRLVLSDSNLEKTKSVEEKSYWEYETKIKISEGKLGVVIGANGGIFAIRKSLFTEIPIRKAVTDDFFVSLSILSKGFKFLYANDAVAMEDVGKDVWIEFKRKIRFASTNFQTLAFFKDLFLFTNSKATFSFISHKVIRWFFPFILIIIFVLNLFLLNYKPIFDYFLILQIAFYFSSLIGLILSVLKIRVKIFSMPFFFIISNVALFIGFFRFLLGRHSVIWQSTER